MIVYQSIHTSSLLLTASKQYLKIASVSILVITTTHALSWIFHYIPGNEGKHLRREARQRAQPWYWPMTASNTYTTHDQALRTAPRTYWSGLIKF